MDSDEQQIGSLKWSRSSKYTPQSLPKNHARRMSPLSKLTVGLATEVSDAADFDHAVFSSRYGELKNTVALIKMLVEKEELSPTKFSQSVHNTSSGLFSILSKSNVSMESVSAGRQSFQMGLVSSLAYLKTNPGSTVLYVYSDDEVPQELRPFADEDDRQSIGVSMLLNFKGDGLAVSLARKQKAISAESSVGSQANIFLKHLFEQRQKSFSIVGQGSEWKFNLL